MKSAIELGAGFSGLAGFAIKEEFKNFKKVVLTDGCEECVEGLVKNICIGSLKLLFSVFSWSIRAFYFFLTKIIQ